MNAMPFAGFLVGFVLYGFLLLPVLLLALAIPYAVLRLRDRAEQPDPYLGLKAALYYFFSVAVLLALSGATCIAVDYLVENKLAAPAPFAQPGVAAVPRPAMGKPPPAEFPNAAQRTGGALIVAGVAFALLHWFMLKVMTNDRSGLATRRLFAGWRLAIHGLVVMFAATALLVLLLQKDFSTDMDTMHTLGGVLLVWVPSWVIHLALVRHYSLSAKGNAAK
jgi:hypothetical protein